MAQYLNENKEIGALVREAETNFISGGGTLMSKYVTSDLYSDINRIYAYLASTHITGAQDAAGRDKPFFNIVLAARNIYYRATDIDRKHIEVKPTQSNQTVAAFLATVHLQNWMRKVNFGAFLNDWGMELAAFNSAVVKLVESGGELHAMVVPWSRLIVDQVNFDANMKIETLELTEAELYKRIKSHKYDKEMVEKLCNALAARETTDHEQKDQKSNYIKLYEVHGVFPLSYLTGKEKDEDTYDQQMHVISYVESKQKGEYDDFTLYAGREEEDPYMLTSLLPSTDGSISLDGSVKNLFTAQWMMNHTVKAMKDQLDLCSKNFFQTADANFVGRNALDSLENGDILIHAVKMPLTQVNNTSHDITVQESFANMWKSLASEINGVSESMLGNNPPSGTAWRQVSTLLQESHSLFELMTENKGLHLEAIIRRVVKFLKKKMDTTDEIAATLDASAITKIDAIYVPQEAIRRHNTQTIDHMSNFNALDPMQEMPQPFNPDQAQAQVKQDLAPLGNQRFFVPSDLDSTTWKEYFKDLEWELEVNITGEAADKQTVLDTLTTALQAVANPAYANNPQAQLIVSKILTATGVISPLEISALPPPPPAPPMQPSVGPPAQGLPVTQPNA